MLFLKSIYLFILSALFLAFTPLSNGQIIFKNLPAKDLVTDDSTFFDVGKTRKILSLHGEWIVYPANSDKNEKVRVEIPSSYEGESELVFEKNFVLTQSDISKHKLRLHFLGLNYSADISLNKISIHRHTGGEFPFSLDLPRDILQADKANVLSIRISNKSDSKHTIPVKQLFHFPKSGGGIFRDVFIHFMPNIFVSDLKSRIYFDSKAKKFFLNVKTKIENRELSIHKDSILESESFSFILALSSASQIIRKTSEVKFQLKKNSETFLTQEFELDASMLWIPIVPRTFVLSAEIYRGENLVDASIRQIALYKLELEGDSLLLNNQKVKLDGITYYPVYGDFGSLISYSQMEKDIRLIKETGFNAVRFSKKIPHPYLIYLCQNYGLLPLIELPINSIPSSILNREDFFNRTVNYTNSFLKGFSSYCLPIIGLGGGFVGSSEEENNFIQNVSQIIKKNSSAITYASFSNLPNNIVDNLDLYGIEVFGEQNAQSNIYRILSNTQINFGRIFISEATYFASRGKSDGYLSKNSYEAQAKFFDEIIDFSKSNSLPGYFLNSMFDYRSHYASIISGYNKEHLLPVGIADENRKNYRIGYKVIFAKLNNAEKVTIPIGTAHDDSPMHFIIAGIIIAIIIGIMINSGKKFREDSSRALLRPYNFFADVRDQRLISVIHTLVMLLIISLTSGLLLSNALFFLKENISFEKILMSFGSSKLLQGVSMLAWNPLASLGWLSLFTLAGFLFLMIIVKAASFFVKTRVAFSSVFHAITWAFLPLLLLVPLGIILYRVLNISEISIYLFIGMFVFTMWVFYRLMKGIYVIFDTKPANVYLYSIIILFIIAVTFVIYFEVSNSAFTYILHTIKNNQLLG